MNPGQHCRLHVACHSVVDGTPHNSRQPRPHIAVHRTTSGFLPGVFTGRTLLLLVR